MRMARSRTPSTFLRAFRMVAVQGRGSNQLYDAEHYELLNAQLWCANEISRQCFR